MSRQQNYTLGKNTDNNIASEYPNYTLQGDYGYSYDSRSDYYQRKLEDRENDINYDNKTTNENSTEDSESRISNWWTSRSMPELLQSSEDTDNKAKNITVLDYKHYQAIQSALLNYCLGFYYSTYILFDLEIVDEFFQRLHRLYRHQLIGA